MDGIIVFVYIVQIDTSIYCHCGPAFSVYFNSKVNIFTMLHYSLR